DGGAGDHALRNAGTPAPSGRGVGSETRHGGRALRLLHDGQADDPEAAERLQGEDWQRLHSAVVSRCVHQARPAAAAADTESDAGRDRGAVLAASCCRLQADGYRCTRPDASPLASASTSATLTRLKSPG